MKIKRGKYKGRNIEGYNIEGTRPTMDRVKESLFAILQNYIKGSIVLDLFAGTGALGWEALSIGASKCYFNDHNPICTNIIKKTKEKLQAEEVDIKTLDYQKALSYYQENNITFDIIFLDPPYQANILNDALENIQNKNLLRENGFVICEKEQETTTISYPIYKEKKYGKKTIIIYQKKES